MPRVKFDGLEAEFVCLPDGRHLVEPGKEIDVPEAAAKSLLRREAWSAVTPTAPTPKSAKSAAQPTQKEG